MRANLPIFKPTQTVTQTKFSGKNDKKNKTESLLDEMIKERDAQNAPKPAKPKKPGKNWLVAGGGAVVAGVLLPGLLPTALLVGGGGYMIYRGGKKRGKND